MTDAEREQILRREAALKGRKCPMFVKLPDAPIIICRGVQPNNTISQYFHTPGARREYLRNFCDDYKCWMGCPIYQIVAEAEEE